MSSINSFLPFAQTFEKELEAPFKIFMSIIIAGSTGAIGRELVVQAVADERITRVVALSRRSIAADEWEATFPALDTTKANSKLMVQAVDWEKFSGKDPKETSGTDLVKENLADQALHDAFSGHDYAAMCMGTTKKDAGSADKFRRCDLEYVTAFTKVVKELNGDSLKQFSQISSEGANATSWFLYMQTKGKADDMTSSQAFPRTSIFRPGLLGRKDKARGVEKFLSCIFVPTMPVENVASALLADALNPNRAKEVEAHVSTHVSEPNVFFFMNGAINKMQTLPPKKKGDDGKK